MPHPTSTDLARAARRGCTAVLALAPALALAHTGADAGHAPTFATGFLHPLQGYDHLAAMVAVGVWSALSARHVWASPLAFAAMLLAGALLGLGGVALPGVEPMIAVSLLVLGLLTASRLALAPALAAGLIGGFALFHGLAHGAELGGSGSAWPVLTGMVCATALLHGCGIALGLALRQRPLWTRLGGGAVALYGLGLAGGLI